MLFDPLLTCEPREVAESQLEELREPDDIITARCIVFFRTSDSYTGTYGFDWLRKGDSGRKGDTSYTEIMGRYEYEDEEDENDYGVFIKDIREYTRFANREFRSCVIAWKEHEDIYHIPIMSLLKSKSATLNLMIDAEEKPKELRFIYDENYFKLSEETIFPPMIGKYILEDALTIECIEEFSKDQKILALAINEKGEDNLAGELIVKANDKNHRRKLNVVLIRVRTDFGMRYRIPTIAGREALLRKYFAQFYINASFITRILDLTRNKSFKERHSTPAGLNFPDDDVFEDLNTIFLNAYPPSLGVDFSNYHKVYFFDEVCNSGDEIYGNAHDIPSKEFVVLRYGLQDSTVAHEMFHALGLEHSFSNDSKYTFEENKTDNIMDYADMHGIPAVSSWKFQWKIVQKYLPKDD